MKEASWNVDLYMGGGKMVNITHRRTFLDGEWGLNKMRMGAVGSMRLQDINKKVVKK